MNDGKRHILLISGGKDSTALAIYMRDRYPEIDMEYLFTDTQKELPETYDFLNRLEAYLEKPIVRIATDEDIGRASCRDRAWIALRRCNMTYNNKLIETMLNTKYDSPSH